MIFHYIETIGRHDVNSITFTVTASDFSYFIVVDGVIINSPRVTTSNQANNRTYTYSGLLPAGALFEFYYNVPLTQPDRFSNTTLDTMVSKSISRLNRVKYSRPSIGVNSLSNIKRVSTFAAINIIRALNTNDGILIEPITAPIPSTSVGILADFYTSAFSIKKPLNTLANITEGGSYYIVTYKGNANLQLYRDRGHSFLTDCIPYNDFNIYILRQSLGDYIGHRFCGAGVDGDIPKLPPRGTYSYPGVENIPDFKYTPFQPPYRDSPSDNTVQQIPVTQFPYRIVVKYSATGSSSDITDIGTTEYTLDDYIGKIEILLQDALGFYYIDIESLGAVLVDDNQYFPYDTSFINLGDITPTDFWTKSVSNNIVRYKTTNKVIPADASKGITKMEFILL